MADFNITDHGSIVIVAPLTDAAQEWVDEHVADDAQWFANGLAVERRYAHALINGILEDGFDVVQS